MTDLLFRHAKFRREQKPFAADCWKALNEKKHVMAHVPTGNGKTDAALSAALTYALQEDRSVFFLTPKISQHAIALEVAKGIRRKYQEPITAIDFVGKRRVCLEPTAYRSDEFHRACERLRKNEACLFYETYTHRRKEAVNSLKDQSFAHLQLKEEGRVQACCPYELALDLARESRLVIADYNHVFLPYFRKPFLHRLRKNLETSILIVDEAHNVFERIRSAMSASMGLPSLRKAREEARKTGAHDLAEKLEGIDFDLQAFAREKLGNQKETVLEKEELFAIVDAPLTLQEELEKNADEYLTKFGDAKRSVSGGMARFLEIWLQGDKESYARLVHNEKGLMVKSLDVRKFTSIVNEASSCIAMSGTLLPLEMHRTVLGFDGERTLLKEYRSSFPPENQLNVFVDGTSTRYSRRTKEAFDAMAYKIQQIIDAAGGKTALFFPSFQVQAAITKRLNTANLVQQEECMGSAQQNRLLLQFEKGQGVLCAVAGGSLAEGVDYDRQQIKCIVVVGIPLAEMNLEQEALIAYFENQFERGWDYGYLYPAVNKALQASGRGIRSESDQCVVVFLDERYLWKNYRKCFPNGFEAIRTREPWKHVQAFLGNEIV
ncbi:ATP-dependent DNA helicase [Candidatus Micrarchaeota archaeon]|nr:ATP-dependent DNA helicase [Candidatus Micrarchaeota archaeon]